MDNENEKLNIQVQNLQREVAHLNDIYFRTHFIDKDVFANPVYINNSLFLGKNGKAGFYGTEPITQPSTISDPSGGATVDSEARTAINTIIDRLQALGLIA